MTSSSTPRTTTCSHCGNEFALVRSTARFCSGRCRQASHARRKRAALDPASTLVQRLTDERVSGAWPYLGSKGTAGAPRILSLIQGHLQAQQVQVPGVRWIEPFAGSTALYIQACRAGLIHPRDAILNDKCQWILITLRVLRDRPGELADAIALTPRSRAECNREWDPAWSDLETARWWITRTHQGYTGAFRSSTFSTDHSRQNYKARRWERLPARLRLLGQLYRYPELEQLDALDLLRRKCTGQHPDVIVADPPYINRESCYPGDWQPHRHRELALVLAEIPAALVAVCYVDHPLVRELYPESRWHWHQLERPTSSALARPGQPRQYRQELLLIRR